MYILSDNFCVQDMNTIKLLAQLLVPRTKAKVFHELSVSCSYVASWLFAIMLLIIFSQSIAMYT